MATQIEQVTLEGRMVGGRYVVLATCLKCGGKYRPEGGPCIHEHPAEGCGGHSAVSGWREQRERHPDAFAANGSLRWQCGICRRDWQPGHTCIVARRPSAREQAEYDAILADIGRAAREACDEDPTALDPEQWD